MTDHTTTSNVSRLEVIATGARRRWTLSEKRRIVAESYGGPQMVSATARRHGLLPNQLFTWRRLAREGRLAAGDGEPTFAQAIVACEPSLTAPPRELERVQATPEAAVARGVMEIILAGGRRVVVDKEVDGAALARVIAVLERP
jgi:transposase